jgi:hypothetical protein
MKREMLAIRGYHGARFTKFWIATQAVGRRTIEKRDADWRTSGVLAYLPLPDDSTAHASFQTNGSDE